MKTRITLFALLLFCSGFSQTKQDQRVWFAYIGQYKVSEKWGYQIEAQFRMDNELEQNLQNLYRIGAIYYLSPKSNLIGGYALIKTFNVSLDEFFSENRLWEQYQYNKKWAADKNMMTHRIRLEQRWVEQLSGMAGVSSATNFQNRLRYLNRNLFHLTHLKSEKEEVYAVMQNELFLNLGDNKVNSKFFDQNRFFVGLGLNYNNNIRLELGYMNHFITSSSGSDVMNHTVSVSLLQNLDLQKH
ncbi:DUF2490 domain-containing protein [Flavobacterium sp.]